LISNQICKDFIGSSHKPNGQPDSANPEVCAIDRFSEMKS